MKYIYEPQGSDGWKKARAGVITGSCFALTRERVNGLSPQLSIFVEKVMAGLEEKAAAEAAGYKDPAKQAKAAMKNEKVLRALDGERVGEFSKGAHQYAFRTAVERISGEPLDEGYETWAMRRGHEMEPEARAAHEALHGVTVKSVGLVLTDDHRFGASADGLILPDEGCEYKCFVAPESLMPIILDANIDDHLDQCQGGLWITGKKRWNFGLYCPALESAGKDFTLFQMPRDDDYIEEMEADLLEFDALVEDYRHRIERAETLHILGRKVRADDAAEQTTRGLFGID